MEYWKTVDLDFLFWTEVPWDENNVETQQSQKPKKARERVTQDNKIAKYNKIAKVNNEDAGYTWDWGEGGRIGAWTPNGEHTHISRYAIDFVKNVQTNMDNGRKRSIRIVWVRPQDVVAEFTGERPPTEP